MQSLETSGQKMWKEMKAVAATLMKSAQESKKVNAKWACYQTSIFANLPLQQRHEHFMKHGKSTCLLILLKIAGVLAPLLACPRGVDLSGWEPVRVKMAIAGVKIRLPVQDHKSANFQISTLP